MLFGRGIVVVVVVVCRAAVAVVAVCRAVAAVVAELTPSSWSAFAAETTVASLLSFVDIIDVGFVITESLSVV